MTNVTLQPKDGSPQVRKLAADELRFRLTTFSHLPKTERNHQACLVAAQACRHYHNETQYGYLCVIPQPWLKVESLLGRLFSKRHQIEPGLYLLDALNHTY